ncbi:hypothetical protein WJX74_004086 [Apatococcus lobatus]|uniref:Uncharacterized protein n=1 Tax=Apatococcus lobatus TaxID=904363 RepID=A0AAW1S5L8_9CHLO
MASASADCHVRIWQAARGSCIAVLSGHTDFVTDLAWSSATQCLASASLDKSVRLWGLADTKNAPVPSGSAPHWGCTAVLVPHDGRVTCLAFLPHGGLLASGSLDGKVRIWNAQTGELHAILKGHPAHITSISPSTNHRLASASGEGTLKVWDTSLSKILFTMNADSGGVTRTLLLDYPVDGLLQAMLIVAFHNPGRNEGRILTWSIDGRTGWLDGKLQAYHRSFDGFRGAVILMEVASCWEQTLVTACTDGTICCLDLVSGTRCAEFNVQALSEASSPVETPFYPHNVLQPHSCVLSNARDGLLWLQGRSLCQLELEGGRYGSLQLRSFPVRLLDQPDGVHVAVGFDNGSLDLYMVPLADHQRMQN